MIDLKNSLHVVLCLLLWFSVFHRASKTCATTTRLDIRLAFFSLSAAALTLVLAPWGCVVMPEVFEPYTVTWQSLILLASVDAVQFTTARHWREGVPKKFLKEQSEFPSGFSGTRG